MKYLLALLFLTGLTQAQDVEEFRVYIDGQEVGEKDEYTFNKDETYELKVEGLKPGSQVNLSYKKAAIKVVEHTYMVPENGRVKKILEAPNKAIGVTCMIEFTEATGTRREIKFRLKFRNLDKDKG